MIFLVEYDRKQGKLETLQAFEQSRRSEAENSRLMIELALHRTGVEHEVVLLEATTEQALRQTYRRYFEDLPQLTSSGSAVLKS